MDKQLMAKNTTFFTAALTFQKLLAFVYFWLISNSLMPGELGQYVFALSYTTLFSIFIDLGLSPILTRESSKSPEQANRFLRGVIGAKIPLMILTVAAAWIFLHLSGKPAEVRLLVYVATAVMIFDSFTLTFWVIFRSRHNLLFESIGTTLVQIIIFSLGYLALQIKGEVVYLILALLAASIFNFLFSALLLKFKLKFKLSPAYDKTVIAHFLKLMPAFAIAGIFIKIYNTADSVLLSYLSGDEAVGFFAIPAKVVYALQQIIPAAFAAVIFPVFSYYYVHSKELLAITFEKAFAYLLFISVPISVGLMSLVPEIITLVWPDYLPVIPTFYLMAAAIPFIFLAFPTGYLLNAADRQKANTANRGIITGFSVALNIILIPYLGYFGAGVTFLASNIILLTLDLLWVNKTIKLQAKVFMAILGKVAVSALVMALAVMLVKNNVHLVLSIAIGGVVYFVALYLLKGFRFSEVKDLFFKRKVDGTTN